MTNARLNQLRRNINEMSPDELRERVRQIRRERRITKERPTTKVAKKVASDKAKDKVMKLLGGMTPEQIAAALKGIK